MALMSAQAPGLGTAMTYSAVTSSDTVIPGDNVYLMVSTGGTGTTVTIVIPGTQYGQARPDVAVVLGTNVAARPFGPLTADMADPATGLVTVTYSATTSVTSALLLMGRS